MVAAGVIAWLLGSEYYGGFRIWFLTLVLGFIQFAIVAGVPICRPESCKHVVAKTITMQTASLLAQYGRLGCSTKVIHSRASSPWSEVSGAEGKGDADAIGTRRADC